MQTKDLIKTLILTSVLLNTLSCLAANTASDNATSKESSTGTSTTPVKPMPKFSITGHPVKRRDSYTVNSNALNQTQLRCIFINTSENPINLAIWNTPVNSHPESIVHLAAGKTSQPVQVTKVFSMSLEPHWWCRVFTHGRQANTWTHCAYFSVADEGVIENNPFTNQDATLHSKNVSYHCRITKPTKAIRIFYQTPPDA